MAHWLYPANIKYYDVLAAFEQEHAVWPINSKIQQQDTIYIYLATPYKKIAYLCTVSDINISKNIISDFSHAFIKNEDQDSVPTKPFMMLSNIKCLLHLENDQLNLIKLKEHGLKGMLMGPRKLENNRPLLNYILGVCS